MNFFLNDNSVQPNGNCIIRDWIEKIRGETLYTNENKQAGMAILISDEKMDFKLKAVERRNEY